jgi:hypothetical protein
MERRKDDGSRVPECDAGLGARDELAAAAALGGVWRAGLPDVSGPGHEGRHDELHDWRDEVAAESEEKHDDGRPGGSDGEGECGEEGEPRQHREPGRPGSHDVSLPRQGKTHRLQHVQQRPQLEPQVRESSIQVYQRSHDYSPRLIGCSFVDCLAKRAHAELESLLADLRSGVKDEVDTVEHGENGAERIIYTALRDADGAYRGVLETVVPIDEAGPAEDAGEAGAESG